MQKSTLQCRSQLYDTETNFTTQKSTLRRRNQLNNNITRIYCFAAIHLFGTKRQFREPPLVSTPKADFYLKKLDKRLVTFIMFCMFVGEKIANICTLVENQLKTAMVFSPSYASLNLNYPL